MTRPSFVLFPDIKNIRQRHLTGAVGSHENMNGGKVDPRGCLYALVVSNFYRYYHRFSLRTLPRGEARASQQHFQMSRYVKLSNLERHYNL